MEKDIDRITKNPETDIVIRIDDFGGRRGVTIREFVKSERYTGFTKSGTRIPAEHFKVFKAAINSIDESDLAGDTNVEQGTLQQGENSGQGDSGENKEEVKKEDKPSEDIEGAI